LGLTEVLGRHNHETGATISENGATRAMCGIAGILGEDRPDDCRIVRTMNGIQNHRGPHAACVQTYSMATLGHTRLSIIDLIDNACSRWKARTAQLCWF